MITLALILGFMIIAGLLAAFGWVISALWWVFIPIIIVFLGIFIDVLIIKKLFSRNKRDSFKE